MVDITVRTRKWGNSLGLTLPKEVVEKEKIKESDKLLITVKKISSLKNLFGTLTSRKSTQTIKDELKKGW